MSSDHSGDGSPYTYVTPQSAVPTDDGQDHQFGSGDNGFCGYPPVPLPTPAANAGTPIIPAAFASFVTGLPTVFTQAFEAASVGGVAWSPAVLPPTQSYLPQSAPVALFADFTAAPAHPLVLSGTAEVGLINDSSVAVTVVDSATPNQYIASGNGGMTLIANAQSGSFVAEGGSNVVMVGAGVTGGWNIDMLGGNNQVWATGGADTIQTAAGSTNIVMLGSGNDSALSGGTDVLFGGSGADTITATGSNDTVVGGSGALTFVGAASTAGTGRNLIFAGTGALDVQGGQNSLAVVMGSAGGTAEGGSAGNNLLFAGSGAATLMGGGSGDYLVGGANGGDQLIAGNGNETLIAGAGGNNTLTGGTGTNVMLLGGGANTVNGTTGGAMQIFAGSGDTSVNAGGANLWMLAGLGGSATVNAGTGVDQFNFVNGQAGGTYVINGFDAATDTLNLYGYTPGSASVASAGGSTTVTLADNTKIQMIGLASLPSSAIV